MGKKLYNRLEGLVPTMELCDCFPAWGKLNDGERARLASAARLRRVPGGTPLHGGGQDCLGFLVLCSGRLRVFILSEGGREITLFRLLEGDACLFSASCMLSGLRLDLSIEAETDAELWVVPSEDYRALMEGSAALANYTNALMASRFSDVMWLLDQILFQSFDARLAAFLLEEAAMEGSDTLHITHERIANHLGSAREVVTRMLKYFQSEGLVSLGRGSVRLLDREGLGTH